jgi:5'-nucleotidase
MALKPSPLILLTNDDGVRSPGLQAVAHAVASLGDIMIVAPAHQQTGMGRGIPPPHSKVILEERQVFAGQETPVFGMPGSPALSVLYGVLALAQRRPDLVISGINYGENLGTSVTASGTLGAALQAAELGVKALAVSLETDQAYHFHHGKDVVWDAAAHFTRLFAETMLQVPRSQLLADVDVIKVDVPVEATSDTVWRVTRQSRQPYYETLPPEAPPPPGEMVRLGYRVNINWETLEPDSDIWAFARDRVVSVTPLSHDLTARVDFAVVERLLRLGE